MSKRLIAAFILAAMCFALLAGCAKEEPAHTTDSAYTPLTQEELDALIKLQTEREIKCLNIALTHAELAENEVNVLSLNYNEGTTTYDIFFVANGLVYTYTIDFESGKVVSFYTTPEDI